MNKVIVILAVVGLLPSCTSNVDENEKLKGFESIAPISQDLISDSLVNENDLEEYIAHVTEEEGVIFTEATVLSVGEELIMPSDYLTTSMHVMTDEGDTLVFLNISEDAANEGDRISLYYKLEKVEDALVCLDCNEYPGNINLIDVTLIPGDVVFKSLKLIKCIPDDYLVLNATFQMEDADGNLSDFKTLDYKMIDDTTKMNEGFYSYGVVSQFYPVLESFE